MNNVELFTDSIASVVNSNRILYTASSFARSSLLHLQEIGELEAKKGHTSSRLGLTSYLFFIVTDGSGVLLYQDKEYALSSGSCVFVDCSFPYSHTTDPCNLWTLRWIHFYGPTVSSVYEKYKERGGRPVFVPEDVERINTLWQTIFSTAAGTDYMRDMLINQQLSELMVYIMSESWHPENQEDLPKKKSLLVNVKSFIDFNYSNKITLDELSEQFFINKYYLSKSFKDQFGQSISSYILSVRVTKAKQLLRFSEKNVEEIGYECGFGAPHYFSQRFKEVEGVPPSKYREQW
ncbi:helix-turn-helix domain-containing protein [Butyrivibrio sp. VCD2006]|uniref:helix-turn-helix domain-containing protein n=1 Tax=Butyrivibrio sp. VCD2006 TaxID=1280664 RepID=UPI00041CFC7A|nr:helix-turn-helix domain-containing protein [Butyrivibrio sp. VCD2006]